MRERRRKFTPEFKDEAVKMVIESSRPIAEVAREIQVNEGTLGNWVNKYRVEHADEEPPLSISERARLRELERGEPRVADEGGVPGKSGGLLRPGVSVSAKYAFIDAREGAVPDREDVRVAAACPPRASTSGGTDRPRRPRAAGPAWPPSSRRSSTTPTAPTGTAASTPRWSVRASTCSPELVRAIMRELGLVPCQPRPWRPTTTVAGDAGADPRPGRPRLHRRRAGHQARRRHHLSPDLAGLAVPGHGDRLPHQGLHRLRDRRPHARRAGHRRPADGRPQLHARRRRDIPFRSRHAIYQPIVRRSRRRARHPPIGRAHRVVFR